MIGWGLGRRGAHPKAGGRRLDGFVKREYLPAHATTERDRPPGRVRIRVREQPCGLSASGHARRRRCRAGHARDAGRRHRGAPRSRSPGCRADRAALPGGGPQGPDPERRDAAPAVGSASNSWATGTSGSRSRVCCRPTTPHCSKCSTAARAPLGTRSTASTIGSCGGWATARPELRRGILLSAYLDDPVSAMRAVGATDALAGVAAGGPGAGRRGCTSRAVPIIAWTVNEVGDLERLARMGVDGLCGNYPDRMRVALAARRSRRPSRPDA